METFQNKSRDVIIKKEISLPRTCSNRSEVDTAKIDELSSFSEEINTNGRKHCANFFYSKQALNNLFSYLVEQNTAAFLGFVQI